MAYFVPNTVCQHICTFHSSVGEIGTRRGWGRDPKVFFTRKEISFVCEFYQILLHESEFDNYVIDFKICCSTISKERGKKKTKGEQKS